MPVDIRATVACSLGAVISGNVNDEYVQGTGLIKCSGTVVISGIITPAIGTAVTFSYTKSGVTRTIPRKLRVLSSFADPFRRTTSVELGCKLTYLSDKKDSIDWTAFDDTENTLTEADAEIITIPIRAQAVAKKCMDELGVSGTFTLTNKFSIAEFDLSPGYVQVLSDLLVSESLCGYLDANEVLQVFSLDQPGGTGPVLDMAQLVDISKIGSGQLPGEAVVVSYSSLKLKKDVKQRGEGEESPWDRLLSSSKYTITVPYEATRTVSVSLPSGNRGITSTTTVRFPATKKYKVLTTTDVSTFYTFISTPEDRKLRLVSLRTTREETSSAAVAGAQITDWLSNGIPFNPIQLFKDTTETYRYDKQGNEIYYEKVVKGSLAYLTGALNSPFAFGGGLLDAVSPDFGTTVTLEAEERETYIEGNYQQVVIKKYAPWSNGLSGQQSIARNYPAYSTPAGVFDYFASLVNDQSMWSGLGSLDQDQWSNAYGLPLIDKRVEIQRRIEPVGAPTAADINNAINAKDGTPSNGYRTESKADLTLALGSATAQRRVEFSLPYAPDDTFTKAGSTYGSVASDAEAKAQLYGRVQNRLLLGNRNGMNLQCAPEVLPGAPFAPFVVKAGSTSALYRTNGTNWTFDAQGLVVSTDALFWGGVGGNAGESWFPIAPGITTLPTTPGTTTVNITDASGNVVGSYEQMTVTGTVPVAQETVALQATLRLRPVVTSLPYALQETAEVAITTKLKAVVSSIKVVNVPVAAVTVAALAPKVSTGVRVLVPAASLAIEPLVPAVASGASVAVPAAGIAVAGLVPETVGRQKTIVEVPVATVQLAGLTPLVASGASVAVPAADITVAGLVPAQVGVEKDPSFSSVSLLLRMDGSNGSTTFTDSSTNAHTITVFGNAQVSTADKKYGTGALTLDGNGDYLQTPANAVFSFGTGNFTVECWCKPRVISDNDGLFTFGGLFVSLYQSNWYLGTGGSGGTSMGTATANSWQHLAVTRSGSSLRLFINGTQLGSTLTDSTNLTQNQLFIGYYFSSFYAFDGLIDEFRVTKGVARYTSNFTAPTAPFPGS